MKQTSFFVKQKLEHGGSLNFGKRKLARVLDSKRPIHLVLKCQKKKSLIQYSNLCNSTLRKQAKCFGIRVYSTSLQRDHWHLCLRITNRVLYRGFIRALTGILARKIGKGLWKLLPYTRVIEWGRSYFRVLEYLLINDCESKGLLEYERGPPY